MINSPPDRVTFQIGVQSGPLAVREALASIMSLLETLPLDVEERSTVELVMAEVLNNVVEHAYPEGGQQGPIDIFGASKRDGLHFRIEDTGLPMPGGQAPIGQPQNLDVEIEDLPEGGFGWFIVRDLAKDVVYARQDNKNVLTLRLALAV